MSNEQLSLGLDPDDGGEPSVAAPPAPAEGAEQLTPAPSAHPPTPEQAAATQSRDRDIFLEAGAGTGKTRVLVERYCEAVDRDEVAPERILAFTFTEKAAAEMRRRVRIELARRAGAAQPGERRQRLEQAARAGESAPITTIHGFCRRLLGTHPAAAGLDPRFRVLDADEADRLAALAFTRALDELGASDEGVVELAAGYRDRLAPIVISAHAELRNRGQLEPALPAMQITALDGAEPADPVELEQLGRAYEAIRALLARFGELYRELKRSRSGVDFDDLQLIALALLRNSQAIAMTQSERFDHLLVDEFQDTSPVQVELIEAVRGPATRLFVVGDENQSIYAFRGADLESFRRERERFTRSLRAEVLPLSGSFRSEPEIVAAVNAVGAALLADFRPLRIGREREAPASAPGDPAVELLLTERPGWGEEGTAIASAAADTAANRIAEARGLALRLRELADGGADPAGMVLLLRAFSDVDAYAEALELAGLDPYVVGGRGYWSAQQVGDALCLLGCLANPLDDEALLGALASPACGASPDALWILRRTAGRRRHLWPALAELSPLLRPPREPQPAAGHQPEAAPPDEAELARRHEAERWRGELPATERERLAEFAERLAGLRAKAALLPLDALLEQAIAEFGLELGALTMDGGPRRAANLAKLVALASEYEAHEGRNLRGFVDYAHARAARSNREAEAAVAAEDHAGVKVMTIHAAKGLEFETVAVADLGRGFAAGGRRRELRFSFGEADEGDPEVAEAGAPRVGLRLARAGADGISSEGFGELTDGAAQAEAEETARLIYVAASRAERRLLLSGLVDPADLEGRPEIKASHSALARLLPALGADAPPSGEERPAPRLLALAAAEPRAGLKLGAPTPPAEIALSLTRASTVAAARLDFDRRQGPATPAAAERLRPPLSALAEARGGGLRALSYAALSDYERCGYRYLTERVLGLGGERQATTESSPSLEDGSRREDDERSLPAEGSRSHRPGDRLGFGRAVHALLEWSARHGWRRPDSERVETALTAEGGVPEHATAAAAAVGGWLDSPLLAELREGGYGFGAELPFRIEVGGALIRGSLDLLATGEGLEPVIVDYKTDALAAGAPAELPAGYRIQRDLYALAVAEATGARRLRSAYAFLAAPDEPLIGELDAAGIDAGRERIERIVAAMRERRFELTSEPHAALCHDCPARERLCPYDSERTLSKG